MIRDAPPDDDCYKLFCDSPVGKPHCDADRIRVLHVNETESLGPYAARYFASKLWFGEQWYMQIDAHMTFARHWDEQSIRMLRAAPSSKPVISHYPPPEMINFESSRDFGADRLCGPEFSDSDIEGHIIRLDGDVGHGGDRISTPRFSPFVAAGYFIADAGILRDAPFDPFLPWIFMGEEIILSSRLWTSGYDLFAPTHPVLGHVYVRQHKPKFWETIHRVFREDGMHNPLQKLVLYRIKHQLRYRDSETVPTNTLLAGLDRYGMGTQRSIESYLEMAGLDMKRGEVRWFDLQWCFDGVPPKGFEQYNSLYQS